MAQDTWVEKLRVVFTLCGRADAADHDLAMNLRSARARHPM